MDPMQDFDLIDESRKYDYDPDKLYCDVCGQEVGQFKTTVSPGVFHCIRCVRENSFRIQRSENAVSPFPIPRKKRRYGQSSSGL